MSGYPDYGKRQDLKAALFFLGCLLAWWLVYYFGMTG